jgi:hypothetical protein
MAKLSTLEYAFVGLSNPPWASSNAAGGSFSAASGQLTMNVPANTASAHASLVTYTSGAYTYWDITESSIVVRVVNAGTQNATLELWAPQLVDSSGNWFGWHIANGQIQADYEGTIIASATYNAFTHAWLRIRETASTTYFDYSSDGVNWTNLTSYADTAHNYVPTAVYVNFYLGSNSSGTNPATTAVLDNLNLTPPVFAQVPDYSLSNNLPAPVATTTIQSFTDLNGEVWVAKNTANANNGQWRRARDVLMGRIWRSAALNFAASPGNVIAFDTVAGDNFGMYTGASFYGFSVPIAGWYEAMGNLQATSSVANTYVQGSIQQNTGPSNGTVVNWSSDNYFTSRASGGLLWRSKALMYLAANDIVNIKAYNQNLFAVSGGAVCSFLCLAYMGSG